MVIIIGDVKETWSYGFAFLFLVVLDDHLAVKWAETFV